MTRERQKSGRARRAEPGRTVTLFGTCPASMTDFKSLLGALRPLGDSSAIARHAGTCPSCLQRLSDLFLATAPEEADPLHRLVDGLNLALYVLAKSALDASRSAATSGFCFDRSPGPLRAAAAEALDRLSALDEYLEGRITRSGEAGPLERLINDAQTPDRPERTGELAESILRRCIGIGGKYGLDAANLLGFIRYRRGDLPGAERLFSAVLERKCADSYERETQAHAMNNLTGVHAGRGDLKSAVLWCERSLMLKERLGLDVRSNYLNLIFFWLEQGTPYGVERARHYLRSLLVLDGGRPYFEHAVEGEGYAASRAAFRRAGLDKEFPEVKLPQERRQKNLDLREKGGAGG